MRYPKQFARFREILCLCPSQFLIGVDGDTSLVAGNLRFAPSPDQLEITLPGLKEGVWETRMRPVGDDEAYEVTLRWSHDAEKGELALDRTMQEWERDEQTYRAGIAPRKGERAELPEGIKWVRAGSYSHDCGSGIIIARAYLSEDNAQKIFGEEGQANMRYYYESLQRAHSDVRGCDTSTIGGASLSLQDVGFKLWKAVDGDRKIIAVRAYANGFRRREDHEAMGEGNWESDGDPYSDEDMDESGKEGGT